MTKSLSRKKYLFKNTAIFTLGNLVTKLIAIFLVPIYTNILTTAQFGIVDLISTLVTVLAPITTLNIAEAVMRFCLDKDADQDSIIKIGNWSLLISSIFALILVPIFMMFNDLKEYSWYIYWYTASAGVSQICLSTLRGKEQLVEYSVGSIVNSFFVAVLNILFLVVWKMGIEGYLLAYIISGFITAIYAFIAGKMWKYLNGMSINYKLLSTMLKFSIVLIPNSFMWWIMNSSDRIMITALIGASANGLYAVACKIPMTVSTLTRIFVQAWNYSAIKEEESEDRDEYSSMIFKRLLEILVLCAIGVMIVIKPFMYIYVNRQYFSAWEYVPCLMIGVVFLTLGTFLSSSYTVHKDSWGFLKSGMAGAIMNVILNWALIPLIGIEGAALATCLSYIAVFVYRIFDTKKYIHLVIFDKGNILGILAMLAVSVLCYFDGIAPVSGMFLILFFTLYLYRKTFIMVFEMVKRKSSKS